MVLDELMALSGVAGLRIAGEDTGDLRHRTVVPRRMLHHVARQKTYTAAINAVIDPDGSDRRLLLPLHQYLHLAEAHDNVLRHHFPAVDGVLLTGASLVTLLCPDNLHHNAGRMHRRRRILGGRAWTAAPHIWHSTASPSILGESAGAATPEAARGGRGGGHRVCCLCCVSARSSFFHAHSHIWAEIGPTNGILGIARKLLTRRTHLACLLNAIV
jgi:hypothetical protein